MQQVVLGIKNDIKAFEDILLNAPVLSKEEIANIVAFRR